MGKKVLKIGVLDSGYESYALEKNLLSENGFDLEVFNDHFGELSNKLIFSRDKTGLFIRQSEIDKSFLDQCPALRAIVRYGIGYDNIDLEEAGKHHIKVANVQGYATNCVAEHAMALMFSCLRSLPKGEMHFHELFGKPPVPDIFELSDKVLGIIGLGRIGSRLTLISKPLFNQVIATDPYVSHERFKLAGATPVDLEKLLAESHVISLHCNLTPETRQLINRATIRRMKHRPVIINTARGPVMHERDVFQALKENRIHSAGIDVWEDEPPGDRQEALVNHPRVVSTGHYAWYSESSIKILQQKAAENMIGLLQGKPVPDRLV